MARRDRCVFLEARCIVRPMIQSFRVKTGFAAQLPAFKGKLKFKPGVNILFGPNGCGKTTALKITGVYCGITTGGWSKHPDPGDIIEIGVLRRKPPNLPDCLAIRAPGQCTANIEWDGTPTFLNAAADRDGLSFFVDRAENSADGMTSMKDQIQEIAQKPSEGQRRIHKIERIAELLDQVPDLTKNPDRKYNSLWVEGWTAFSEYVKTLPRTGPSTILLDEPDMSLSLPNQMVLWNEIVPKLAKRFQVIATSHSPFILYKSWHFLDLQEGYLAECRERVRAWTEI